MRKRFFLILVVLTAAGLIGFSTALAKDIKVGAVINLTGPASTWGQFHAKGHQDYFRYVNEVKGGIGGNKIDLTIVDHAYKVPEAVKFVKKFCTEDKMDIIATWDAGSGIMAKPIIQEYKVPNINYSTYQGILKPPVDYAYLPFGAYTMDSYAVLEYIRTIHKGTEAPKVGLLTYNNAYGKSIHDASKEYAEKNNVNIVAIEEFPPASLDLNTELLRLKNAGPSISSCSAFLRLSSWPFNRPTASTTTCPSSGPGPPRTRISLSAARASSATGCTCSSRAGCRSTARRA